MIRRVLYALVLLTTFVAQPTLSPNTAADSSQQAGALQGKTVLFSVDQREAGPFDLEAGGASRFASLLARGGANIQELNWLTPIPETADLVVLLGADRDYSAAQTARLWAYLTQGGSLLLLADPPNVGNRRALEGSAALFELLWADFGIRMAGTVLLNPPGGTPPPAPAQTEDADGNPLPTPTPVPTEGVIERMSDFSTQGVQHPVLSGVTVENLAMDGVRPVEAQQFAGGASVAELLFTTSLPYGEGDTANFVRNGVFHFNPEEDMAQANYPIVAVSENPATGSRIVLIGDADIGKNGYGFVTSPPESEAFVFPDAAHLVLNAAYWLLDSAPPAFASPTITPTPDATAG